MMPGGNIARSDTNAPKEIRSENIVFFEVSSSFAGIAGVTDLSYVYAYAAKTEEGALAALTVSESSSSGQGQAFSAAAPVDAGIFKELQQIVKKYGFVKNNGLTHTVSGLPQNFGGSISIDYASGEYIFVSDNRSPVMSPDAGREIADVLKKYITVKKLKTPAASEITAVSYREENKDGNYKRITLEDSKLTGAYRYGAAENLNISKEKAVPADAMEKIRAWAEKGALLSWKGLPVSSFKIFPDKTEQVIFTVKDGRQYVIDTDMKKPGLANNIIFEIYSYLEFDLGK